MSSANALKLDWSQILSFGKQFTSPNAQNLRLFQIEVIWRQVKKRGLEDEISFRKDGKDFR